MSSRRSEELLKHLELGLAASTVRPSFYDLVGVSPEAEDRELAFALVRGASLEKFEGIVLERPEESPATSEVEPIVAADASFLGRLAAHSGERGLAVDQLEDMRTLVAVMRAGTVEQRRAALIRIGDRLVEPKGVPADQLRGLLSILSQDRDVELAYERASVRARMSGAIGREGRSEREQWRRLVARVEREIELFWDGERVQEPVEELPAVQRAHLLMRTRDLPDLVVNHLGAVIEGVDGVSDRGARSALLSSLRHAGDSRLIPAFVSVLESGDPELMVDAARAMARIEDPRVRPALLSAFERSVFDAQKVVFAGALGATGDQRGSDYVRGLLTGNDVVVVRRALQALETLGGAGDFEIVAALVDHADSRVASQAVRTLARLGDGRVLGRLARMRDNTTISATLGEIEDAEAAIRARMELRGEELEDPESAERIERASQVGLATRHDPASIRVWSWIDYLLGSLWLTIGSIERGVARLEAATARRIGWAPPLILMAMTYAKRGHDALALSAFRRALSAQRSRVESQPLVVRTMTQSFLRRSESMERSGRLDIARGLLEEVLAFDLRHASAALRFELERRLEGLRRQGT